MIDRRDDSGIRYEAARCQPVKGRLGQMNRLEDRPGFRNLGHFPPTAHLHHAATSALQNVNIPLDRLYEESHLIKGRLYSAARHADILPALHSWAKITTRVKELKQRLGDIPGRPLVKESAFA
jgi:hypothetical protein